MDDLTQPWEPFSPAMPPHKVEPNLAPGGLVFDTWADGRRHRRSLIPAEMITEKEHVLEGMATADAQALLPLDVDYAYLAVYDGDTGDGVYLLRVERESRSL